MDAMTDFSVPERAITAGDGMLLIWHDAASGQLAMVRDWYAREHHFERLAIPGFLAASRYERVARAGAEIFGCYHVESPRVLGSDAYRARVQTPTPGTREAMRHFRNMSRTVCAIAAQAGRAQGGHLATLASNSGEAPQWRDLCTRLLTLPGALRATALVAVSDEPAPATAEQALRGGRDASVQWALLIDADSQEAAEVALDLAIAASHCRAPAQAAVYRLAFTARPLS